MFADPNSGANVALLSVLKKFSDLLNGLRGVEISTGKSYVRNRVYWRKSIGGFLVRRVGFEPTNPCGIGASVLRLWPCWATSACVSGNIETWHI